MIGGEGRVSGKYYTDQVNVIDKLYRPCLKWASTYVRDAGYFKSNVYNAMSEEILDFILRNKKNHITLITCIDVYPSDFDAIVSEQSRSEEEVLKELRSMLVNDQLADPVKMLAAIVHAGQMTVYVSLRKREKDTPYSLDHSKSGFFSNDEKMVVFDGSINETYPALLSGLGKGNKEHFNVWAKWEQDAESWKDFANPVITRLTSDIEKDGFRDGAKESSGEGTIIVEIDSISREQLPTLKDEDWDPENHKERAAKRSANLYKEFEKKLASGSNLHDDDKDEQERHQKKDSAVEEESNDSHENVEEWVGGRDHQKEALEKWEDVGKRGILKHATGSGKTVTAIAAIERHLKENEENFSIVVVPLVKLQSQWQKEIEKFGMETILIGGDSGASMQELVIDQLSKNLFFDNSVLIVVKDTFIGDSFRKAIKSGSQTRERCLLVFDECHRASEPRFQWLLDNEVVFKSTLGLSATPYPSTDEEQETSDEIWDLDDIKQSYEFNNLVRKERVIKLLGDVIHEFSLADGIAKGYLTPYQYHLERVHMSNQEQVEYDAFRKQIGKFMNMDSNPAIHQARMVIKSVGAKLRGLEKVLKDHYLPGQHWLVYCAHSAYLDEARNIIREITGDWWEYTSKNIESREEHIARFEEDGGILLAVKCLDEGVDIPMITHGVILSSSMVEREFVQRRGRMLRVDKEKKKDEAHIYDFAVIPHQSAGKSATQSILNGELKRIKQFMLDADNEKHVKFTYDALEKILNERMKKRSRRR